MLHETRSEPSRLGYQRVRSESMFAEECTDKAVDFLRRRHTDRPLYLSVGYMEPHRIARAGDPAADLDFIGAHIQPDVSRGLEIPGYLPDMPGTRSELAELQGAIRFVDAQVGRLLSTVDYSNTLVIFTTDHGIAMPRAKCSLYDPGIKAALLMHWPVWHGVRGELVSNIDVLPTILELVNVPEPANVQGRSLMRPAKGGEIPTEGGATLAGRTEIFVEITYHDYYDPCRCIRTMTHKLIANFTTAPAFMDPTQSWRPRADTVVPKNPAFSKHDYIELYDLRTDPWERVNVAYAPEQANVRRDLIARLRHHLIATDDPILRGAITSPHHHRTLGYLEE